MLAVGLAAWIGAMRDTNLGLCSNVEYEAYADETASGCGTGPIPSKIRRAVRRRDNKVLFQRNDYEMEKRCEEKRDTQEGKRCGGGGEGMLCHYNGRVCDAPNEISKYLFLPIRRQRPPSSTKGLAKFTLQKWLMACSSCHQS